MGHRLVILVYRNYIMMDSSCQTTTGMMGRCFGRDFIDLGRKIKVEPPKKFMDIQLRYNSMFIYLLDLAGAMSMYARVEDAFCLYLVTLRGKMNHPPSHTSTFYRQGEANI
jgi:hypothetical protein